MSEEKLIYFFSFLLSKLINNSKSLKNYFFENILVIKWDEIGDMVTSLHVFERLKQSYPTAKITLFCKQFIKPLIENDPNIDFIITNVKDLKDKKYDLIVDLRGNWNSIIYALLNLPKVRLDRGSVRLKNKIKGSHPHEVFTNLQIIAPVLKRPLESPRLKLYYADEQLEKVDKFISRNELKNFAVLHTGARKLLRKWPLDNYIKIADYLKGTKNWDIIFTGDNNDKEDISYISEGLSFKTYSIAGEFSLIEYATLTSKAKLFIGNESGPMHIASATGIPVIGLFGPGVPFVFYPYGDNCKYIHHVLECNPCDQIHCVHPNNPCIARISLNEVIQKIEEFE